MAEAAPQVDPWAAFRGGADVGAAADPWAAFRAGAASPVGIPEDVAKSAAIGPVKAAIGTAGQAANASDIGLHISNWVMRKLFGDEVADKQMKTIKDLGLEGTPILPIPGTAPIGSGEIQKSLEMNTGPLYEPQTTAGKYAQTGTEFATAAALQPGGAVRKAVTTLASAIPSEYLGQKWEGTALEPWARILGAIGGGVGAAGGGKVLEAMGNRSLASAAGTAATQPGGTPITPGAISRVAQSYAADDLTPAAVAARQAALGPESMMLDMGRQLQGRAETMAGQPGRQQNTVLNAVEGRTGDFGEAAAGRIKDTLDTHMGPSPNLVEAEKTINRVVDSHAKPAYDKVMGDHPVLEVPAEIMERPAVASAMKDATKLAKQYGEKLESPTETKTILKGPGYHIADETTEPAKTSLRYWDYVKKSLDARINSYMRSGGTSELNSADKADLGGLMDARRALVGHLDEATGGAYKNARQIAATKPEVKEGIDFGRSMFNTKILKEEVADHLDNMSVPAQAGAKMGARREVDRIIDTARNDGAAARRLLDTNENGAKIEFMFGPRARQAIEDRIAAETTFQNAKERIANNSRTSVRQQLAKDTEAPSISAPPSTTMLGIAHSGLRGVRQYLGDLSLERTREGIGNLVTRSGNDIPTLARILSDYNAGHAANAAVPVGQQAKGLAALLASQQPQIFGGNRQ